MFKVHRIKEVAPQSHLFSDSTACSLAPCWDLSSRYSEIGDASESMTTIAAMRIPPLQGGLVLTGSGVQVRCGGEGQGRTWSKGNLGVGGGTRWIDVLSPCARGGATEEKMFNREMLEEEKREEGEDGRDEERDPGWVSKCYPKKSWRRK